MLSSLLFVVEDVHTIGFVETACIADYNDFISNFLKLMTSEHNCFLIRIILVISLNHPLWEPKKSPLVPSHLTRQPWTSRHCKISILLPFYRVTELCIVRLA
jgi:hypothetical protein